MTAPSDRIESGSTPTWLTADDLAAMLQVSSKTISRWTLREGLPALRIGKVTRYDRAAVDRWLARQQQRASKRTDSTAATS
ncbi:MAG: helix-turn-helix domain-containing protein [Candidatus Rokuibacteriota bacterium]